MHQILHRFESLLANRVGSTIYVAAWWSGEFTSIFDPPLEPRLIMELCIKHLMNSLQYMIQLSRVSKFVEW
jgi:hypothetical protein